MNPNDNNDYNPAEDDNQGVVQLMAQSEEANAGVAQAQYMNPVTAPGPEAEKAEVSDRADLLPSDTDTESDGINDDLLAEEAVEAGETGQ
ncbi:hypothetical protein [Spirosoma areae]